MNMSLIYYIFLSLIIVLYVIMKCESRAMCENCGFDNNHIKRHDSSFGHKDTENHIYKKNNTKVYRDWTIDRKSRPPYVVVQHSISIGNFTLVKVPFLAYFPAQVYCMKRGGHLPIIQTLEQLDHLRKLFKVFSHENDDNIYEAYIDLGERSRHMMVEGEYLGADGDMYQDIEKSGKELCPTLRKEGVLNKVECSWSLAFFCETGLTTEYTK